MSESIPRMLAESLIDPMNGDTSVMVGRAPTRFPTALLADDLEVLGGIEDEYRCVTVLYAKTLDAQSARAAIEARMIADGYTPPPPRSGFVMGGDHGFCQHVKGDIGLSVHVRPAGDTGCLIQVAVSPRFDMDERNMHAMLRAGRDERPMPVLRPPPNTHAVGGGSSGGGSVSNIETQLQPAVNAIAALQHFHQQLLEQQWVPVGQFSTERSAVGSYHLTDTKGDQWAGVLGIIDNADGKRSTANFALMNLSGRSNRRGSFSSAAMQAVPLPPVK